MFSQIRPRPGGRLSIALLFGGLLLGGGAPLYAYSVLSHEALIDAAWDSDLKPLLRQRYPYASDDDLLRAHAFAYGGAIIQDLGYYPHGSHYFSDLLHYIRSGDFIAALLRDAQDLDEFAFALGALEHYAADSKGHLYAVNRAVPLLYPKLRRQYGSVVTYEDDPAAHLKTEFGFDVLELAKHHYASDGYRDMIGFSVSQRLPERAFEETYSIPLRSVLDDFDHAIGSYRWAVRSLIPKATKVGWELKKDEIEQELPGITRRKFLYNMSRASFEKEWGGNYDHPGFSDKLLAFGVSIIPKIGPLKALSFRTPTPATEKMFMASFNAALDEYRRVLRQFASGEMRLANDNFDTGSIERPGAYFMQDNAYARLLGDLADEGFQSVSAALRTEILRYFDRLPIPVRIPRDKVKKLRIDWDKVAEQIEQLKAAQPRTEQARAGAPDE